MSNTAAEERPLHAVWVVYGRNQGDEAKRTSLQVRCPQDDAERGPRGALAPRAAAHLGIAETARPSTSAVGSRGCPPPWAAALPEDAPTPAAVFARARL